MPQHRRNTRNNKRNISDELETSNNVTLLSPNNDNTSSNTSPETQEYLAANIATTSKASTNTSDPSSEVPLAVKRYIDAAFQEQTLELKTLFQQLTNNCTNLFSSNNQQQLDTDSDTNSNQSNYNHTKTNRDETTTVLSNRKDEPIRRNSKRDVSKLTDNNDNNNSNNKKPRTMQGEQQ